MSNSEGVEKTGAKRSPSYYATTKARNNSDSLVFGPSIVGVRSCGSKCMTKNNESLSMATKSSQSYYGASKEQNGSDYLIPNPLPISVRSRESEHSNTKNDDNMQDGTSSQIRTIERQRLKKSRNIFI